MIRRYERERLGEPIHADVRKPGRIPDGGGRKTNGRQAGRQVRGMGFGHVHSAVDDHSRLARSEIHPDEKVATCAGFLARAAAFFPSRGIDRIERVLTDNAWAYRKGLARKAAPRNSARPASRPGPTGRRPTARSNASTAPCSTNGPTCGPPPRTPSGQRPWQTSSTPTTTTAATPHSTDTHPSAMSTTSQVNTFRAYPADLD
ncbi:hypothetical protein GCM10010275_72010 [Streptomyces litmocidini]|nr:hypothetical protein GCM10010275_72010 [Streptomyces litmocidini]